MLSHEAWKFVIWTAGSIVLHLASGGSIGLSAIVALFIVYEDYVADAFR